MVTQLTGGSGPKAQGNIHTSTFQVKPLVLAWGRPAFPGRCIGESKLFWLLVKASWRQILSGEVGPGPASSNQPLPILSN